MVRNYEKKVKHACKERLNVPSLISYKLNMSLEGISSYSTIILYFHVSLSF